MKIFFGWTPDLLPALLVAFGMIFGFYEIIFFAGFSGWVINWQPHPGPEIFILWALAFLSFFGRFFMPWQRWVSVILLTASGIFAIYAAGAFRSIAPNAEFLLTDAVFSVLFAFILLKVFRFFYGKV